MKKEQIEMMLRRAERELSDEVNGMTPESLPWAWVINLANELLKREKLLEKVK